MMENILPKAALIKRLDLNTLVLVKSYILSERENKVIADQLLRLLVNGGCTQEMGEVLKGEDKMVCSCLM